MPPLPTIFVDTARRPGAVLPPFIRDGSFTFPTSGLTSFFGGSSTFRAASAVVLMPGRRWLGWYNSPGTAAIAEQFVRLSNLPIVSRLFPSGERDPTRVFQLHGKTGKKYVAAHSGVILDFTGHPASLLTSKAEASPHSRTFDKQGTHGQGGTGQNVTIVNLQKQSMQSQDLKMPLSFSAPPLRLDTLLSLVPLLVSVVACVMCALVADWWCFASIALGMVAHGSVCAIIGSGKLTFTAPNAAEDGPPGDGVLVSESEAVILVGPGTSTNIFTRGRFFLKFAADKEDEAPSETSEGTQPGAKEDTKEKHEGTQGKSADECTLSTPSPSSSPTPRTSTAARLTPTVTHAATPVRTFWRCLVNTFKNWKEYLVVVVTFLLIIQPLVQLFSIPRGTLTGQVMFVISIIVSWAYNAWISYRIDSDVILNNFLFQKLGLDDSMHVQKFRLTTLTSAVAFIGFVLASARPKFMDPLTFLDAMLQPNSVVWKAWKEAMAAVLKDREIVNAQPAEKPLFSDADLMRVDGEYRALLRIFFNDAQDAWKAWCTVRGDEKMIALREAKWTITK